MSQPKKRRIVLIDQRFQLRMAAEFVALHVLLTAIFATGLYIFMDSEVHADLASAHASYQSLSQMLLPIVVVLAVFSITLSIVLVTGFVVMTSHKIAGPLYRFGTVLESLAQHRFESLLRIRPDDQLGELAVSIDKVVSTFKTDIDLLHQASTRLRDCQARGDKEGVAAEIARIENTLSLWKEANGAAPTHAIADSAGKSMMH